MDIAQIFRPSILKLRAYSSARSLATQGSVFLDANESPDGREDQDSSLIPFNRYPQPQPAELVQKFSELYHVSAQNILIGRGSDEAIDIITRAVCEPAVDSILTTPPTYGMYEVSADIQNCALIKVPLLFTKNSWALDTDQMIAQMRDEKNKVKIVYICSPNNPTGSVFSQEQISKIAKNLPPSTLLVLDEAYAEFTEQTYGFELQKQFPQVIVLRTLSKAWGLAGLRCGVMVAAPELLTVFQKVRAPYPLPSPVIGLAIRALSSQGKMAMGQRVRAICEERELLKRELLKNPEVVQVFPSEGNFLLVEFKDAKKMMNMAAHRGIILRDRSGEIANTIRITIGHAQETQMLLESLNPSENRL